MSLLDAGRDANAGCAPRLCAPRSPTGSQRARLLCVAVLVVLTACADEAVATAPLTPRQLELQCAALAAEERSRCGADELAALPAICARLERGVTDAGPGGGPRLLRLTSIMGLASMPRSTAKRCSAIGVIRAIPGCTGACASFVTASRPCQRYDVIWKARERGKWLIHCHIPHHTSNNNAETRGGGGLMVVVDVQ